MIISQVVAAGNNNEIGKDNQLLWHLPNDLKFFKNVTWGMPVIMGRKTFESLGKKLLKGRKNIIITRNKEWSFDGVEVAHSVEQAINIAEKNYVKECYVIGGAEIYQLFLPHTNRIYLTRVHQSFEADSFFPDFNKDEWELITNTGFDPDEKHLWPYSFQVWEKKQGDKSEKDV